ncbi:MAG: YdeI/OmpD-associated family protein [Candidatus Sulfotelmatobacter sp.]
MKAKPKSAKEKSAKEKTAGPARLFSSQSQWEAWLESNHRKSDGLWLRLAKKASGLTSVSYGEALEIAICYGWIDGQKRPEGEQAWLQRFVPRSAKSVWSKINREKSLALIAQGRMQAAGLEAIENAKKNGRWESAYDSPKSAEVPDDLYAALDASQEAREFFLSLDRANRYAILYRIQTVKKAATRAAKIRHFVGMLERKERIHQPRQPRRK